jgi:NAD-dependent dihydropyrimidine dehydrogenase PreA subunit
MNDLHGTCRPDAGDLAPVVDRSRCEGKADCLRVATPVERKSLGLLAGLKSLAHGHKKAFVLHADQCHACGLCVEACPETAIRLFKARPTDAKSL